MGLSPAERKLVRLFAASVLGRFEEVIRVRRSAGDDEPNRAWRETVLQVHVFAGFPRAVETYAVLASEGGLGELEPGECDESGDSARASSRGRELFERIYRADASKVRETLNVAHPDFAAWIEEHAYGRVLSRPGLTAAQRELIAVSALTVLGQDRQLASHVRGALRCGASREALDDVHAVVRDLMNDERAERTREIIAHFGSNAT